MSSLRIIAGRSAYRKIKSSGLSPADVRVVPGASGAAKWLVIYGLDKAIFADFLPASQQPVLLYGTSVGAFKLAAACQASPAQALTRLALAYIDQYYGAGISSSSVVNETRKILDAVMTEQGIGELLNNSRFSFNCGAVRCKGLLASRSPRLQKLAMMQAFLLALIGRSQQQHIFSRTIFGDRLQAGHFKAGDGFETDFIEINKDNLKQAVLASGSIPVLMPGVTDINTGSVPAVYRDGGLLDYHPVPDNVLAPISGLVLYPHFYPYLIEGWFDKFFPWRKVALSRLDNVVLVSPSSEFVCSLPQSRIPDRQDFYRYKGQDARRQQIWREVMERSEELGAEWLSLTKSGKIADVVEMLD